MVGWSADGWLASGDEEGFGVCEDACVEILGLAIAPLALALAVALPHDWERRERGCRCSGSFNEPQWNNQRRRVAHWHAMLKLMHLDRSRRGGVRAHAPRSARQPEILTVEVLRGGGGGGSGGPEIA